GAKSSDGCALGGCRIEVLDRSGAVLAQGALVRSPWPGTDARFWSEIELCAPSAPGVVSLAVRCDDSAASPFSVAVVAAPAHVVTPHVAPWGGAVDLRAD